MVLIVREPDVRWPSMGESSPDPADRELSEGQFPPEGQTNRTRDARGWLCRVRQIVVRTVWRCRRLATDAVNASVLSPATMCPAPDTSMNSTVGNRAQNAAAFSALTRSLARPRTSRTGTLSNASRHLPTLDQDATSCCLCGGPIGQFRSRCSRPFPRNPAPPEGTPPARKVPISGGGPGDWWIAGSVGHRAGRLLVACRPLKSPNVPRPDPVDLHFQRETEHDSDDHDHP